MSPSFLKCNGYVKDSWCSSPIILLPVTPFSLVDSQPLLVAEYPAASWVITPVLAYFASIFSIWRLHFLLPLYMHAATRFFRFWFPYRHRPWSLVLYWSPLHWQSLRGCLSAQRHRHSLVCADWSRRTRLLYLVCCNTVLSWWRLSIASRAIMKYIGDDISLYNTTPHRESFWEYILFVCIFHFSFGRGAAVYRPQDRSGLRCCLSLPQSLLHPKIYAQLNQRPPSSRWMSTPAASLPSAFCTLVCEESARCLGSRVLNNNNNWSCFKLIYKWILTYTS